MLRLFLIVLLTLATLPLAARAGDIALLPALTLHVNEHSRYRDDPRWRQRNNPYYYRHWHHHHQHGNRWHPYYFGENRHHRVHGYHTGRHHDGRHRHHH